jgi:hypothetical protein
MGYAARGFYGISMFVTHHMINVDFCHILTLRSPSLLALLLLLPLIQQTLLLLLLLMSVVDVTADAAVPCGLPLVPNVVIVVVIKLNRVRRCCRWMADPGVLWP